MKKNVLLFVFVSFFMFGFGQEKNNKKYVGNFDMLTYTNLTSEDEELLYEISLIENELTFFNEYLNQSKDKLREYELLIGPSEEDASARLKRKYRKTKLDILYTQSDIEESNLLVKQLLYSLYDKKIKEDKIASSGNDSREIRLNIKDAKDIYGMVKDYSLLINEKDDIEDINRVLSSANDTYDKAIEKQRMAIAGANMVALYDDKKIDESDFENFFTANNTVRKESVEDNQNIVASVENSLLDIEPIEVTSSREQCVNENIVFRIQIGAFLNHVNSDEIHGLSPIVIDESNIEYSKVLVGEHYSYKSALMALRVIRNTTEYKDAFVVVYCDGERKSIANVMNSNKDNFDMSAYNSYKEENK